jgi:hypothetical protein
MVLVPPFVIPPILKVGPYEREEYFRKIIWMRAGAWDHLVFHFFFAFWTGDLAFFFGFGALGKE